jgi:lipopolysaccharide/colanic/teichoic acid biosynthesis glycosyltransferase
MGRLYCCGFKVIDEKSIGSSLYFIAKKTKEPDLESKPSFGPIYRMQRIGKNGKIINVYKIRTMHAYAEYLQEYVYEKNSLKEGGKFKDDFRISTIGKFFRRYWLDELPMLINLFKGDVKLVGVRPLSRHYLSLYSEQVIQKRLKHKPGLIPPFYADLPKTLDEIMQSELRYLEQYEKAPFSTDVSYFFRALRNILFRKVRSN